MSFKYCINFEINFISYEQQKFYFTMITENVKNDSNNFPRQKTSKQSCSYCVGTDDL